MMWSVWIFISVGNGGSSDCVSGVVQRIYPFTLFWHNFSTTIDPRNPGVLIVQLEGGTAAER